VKEGPAGTGEAARSGGWVRADTPAWNGEAVRIGDAAKTGERPRPNADFPSRLRQIREKERVGLCTLVLVLISKGVPRGVWPRRPWQGTTLRFGHHFGYTR